MSQTIQFPTDFLEEYHLKNLVNLQEYISEVKNSNLKSTNLKKLINNNRDKLKSNLFNNFETTYDEKIGKDFKVTHPILKTKVEFKYLLKFWVNFIDEYIMDVYDRDTKILQ